MKSQMPCVGYPSHFSAQLLAELIEAGSKAINIAADPIPLVGHHFAILILILIQIQTKANCEAKKLRSKLVDLAS